MAIDEADRPVWRAALRKALPFLIGVPLVLAFGALLYFASIAAKERESALQQQQQSYEIIALARRLDGSVAKAESNLARYVISMEPDIGRLYQDQWRQAGSELQALKNATLEDPVQRHDVAVLEKAYQDRGARLSDIGLRITYDQKTAALGKFYEAGKAEDLARITKALDAVIKSENDRLAEHSLDVSRTSDQSQYFSRTYRLFALALVIALLSLAWYVFSVIEDRRLQARLIAEEANRTLGLERAVAARTQELELAYEQLKQESAERSAAEESLRQLQKLEAVGQLTGGIAHDFNNMLSVVVGGMELAKRKIANDPDQAARHIDNAMEGATRASALTRRLLAFARSEPSMPEALNPEDLVEGMSDLIDRTIGDQIRVELALDSGGWAIFADKHQLENAILNLAVNARDAMDGRGTLTVSVSQATLAAMEIEGARAGDYVLLSVSDTGCGMTREVLDHIFEPFFTTKPVGKGTGLGLSQIFGFVHQCHGEIRALSEPGAGTTIEIYLPRHAGAVRQMSAPFSNVPSVESAPQEGYEQTLTILLIEDDPRVLAQTSAALAELGHVAVCCDHPSQCVQALRDNADVDLILSDVMMPDVTGPEMIAALPPEFRSVPVLFLTGFAGNVSDNSLFEGYRILRKPYTLAGLAAAMSETLSESHQSRTSAARG